MIVRSLLTGWVAVAGLALAGCGRTTPPGPGPSIYAPDIPNGGPAKLGRKHKTPGYRLSSEGHATK